MSNSPLVNYTKISPNRTNSRKYPITRISIHCVVGQVTVESLGNIFAPTSRQASSNYGIGKDGRVGMYVEECDRSWCTSSADNDHRAVTIETASDTTHPYAVTSAAYAALLDLCTDICKRNGKKKLLWFDNKEKALAYKPAADEMVLTVHRWFANKACPGEYLYSRHKEIAEEVTKRLSGAANNTTKEETTTKGESTVNIELTVLRKGSEGEQVKTLQRILYAIGYDLGTKNPIDGDFGSKTDSAVRTFQKLHKLGVDGIVGKDTWNKLLKG